MTTFRPRAALGTPTSRSLTTVPDDIDHQIPGALDVEAEAPAVTAACAVARGEEQ